MKNPVPLHILLTNDDGDVRAHLEGYITISAIKPRWNPPASQSEELRERLSALGLGFKL